MSVASRRIRREVGRRRVVVGLLLAGLGGCSADAVEEPAPALEQAGTFFALRDAPDHFRLLRVRNSVRFDARHTYLFLDEYRPGAKSLAEARALARNPDLSLLPIDVALLEDVIEGPYFIVWHRSLREDERD